MSVPAAAAAERSRITGFDLPVQGVRIVVMPRFVDRIIGASVHAITLVHTIVVNPVFYDRVVAGEEPELLAHELLHVEQWDRHGIGGFLWRYITDYLRLRMLGADHRAAYLGIGFEHQAFTGSHEIRELL